MCAAVGSFKCGFVGILGQTNVGKSTFLNAVMEQKLSIASDKPQTTRNRIRCVYNAEGIQIVFVDTPGLHRPQNKLGRRIVREAFRAVRDLNLLVYMVEPWRQVTDYDRGLLEHIETEDRPLLLLVNKTDLARGNDLEETLLAYDGIGRFEALVPISSKTGFNVDEALRTIIDYLPEGRPVFPSDVRVDASDSFMVSELIREKVVQETRQEVPYSTAVRVKWITERADGLVEILAEIVVERESQKGILIGRGGRMIKFIGTRARADIETLLGRRVYLELRVRVSRGWTKDDQEIETLVGRDPGESL